MGKAIRDHLRDLLAILGLTAVALLATYIIVQNERLRIPLLEEKPFELKAELSTAQAVTPGQGQTVRVAGVRVGDISKVDYEDGHAVVTMDIDRKFLPVYRDATILLRPKTGLKDMFLELDPGTDYQPSSREDEFQNGDAIQLANTAPDTNVDEVLAALDTDTRAYPAAAHPGRPGPERTRPGPREAARQPRADQPRASPAQHGGGEAQGEPENADPQHEPT